MSRRDGFNGDWLEITFDSYHDLRSAFSFTVSAAGVKSDKNVSLNGTNQDIAWNPIWYTQSKITESGWTAEMKIPLSQLRFGTNQEQTWGLQVQRRLLREEETSVWQRIPLDAPGWVSEFGELHGLIGLKPQKQFEIQPFIVSSLKTYELEPMNPYRDSYTKEINVGLDGKIGITNDLTLDFTVNPDFGQVEADPAAIALDGFQLFFEERRPFFIENKSIFDYRFSTPIIGGSYSSDNLFYSRRVGRRPQGSATSTAGEYVNAPQRSSIISAIKFSGKTKNGLSIGILESVTASEYAEISDGVHVKNQLIEPQTNYAVARLQKDFNNRNTFIGGMITSVHRQMDQEIDFLHQSAFTGGLDMAHQWDNRTWYAGANLVMSHVSGSAKAIQRTQTSIAHLYQRKDAHHLSLDSTKTSLTGTGGDIKIGKAGKGNLKFETGLTWRSPGLELNDLGFIREADVIQNYFGSTYSSVSSFGAFRKASIGYKHWLVWDFDANFNYADIDIELNGTFNNNWTGTFGVFYQPHNYSKSLLRGGPRLYLPAQYGAWWAASSDTRKKIYVNYDGWTKTGGIGSYYLIENGLGVTYQPIDRFSMTLTQRYALTNHRIQYNDQLVYQTEDRYIASYLDQKTLSLSLRLNLTINANLVIQYYAEPYITTGKYNNFNFVANPLERDKNDQLQFYKPEQLTFDASQQQYLVDENGDETTDYSFPDPDFTFTQFRSNFVVRYEYKPGSEIFLVWAQGTSQFSTPQGDFFQNLGGQIFSKPPENTFLIKATYRFVK